MFCLKGGSHKVGYFINCTVVFCRHMSNAMKIMLKKRYKQRKLRQEQNGHKILQVMLLGLEVSSCTCSTKKETVIHVVCGQHILLRRDNLAETLFVSNISVTMLTFSCTGHFFGLVVFLILWLLYIPDDEDDLQEDLSSLTEKANIDSLRLSKFLQRASQVSSTLFLPLQYSM